MFKKRNPALIQEKISEKTNFVVLRKTVVHKILNRLTCLMYNENMSPLTLEDYVCMYVIYAASVQKRFYRA